MQLSLLIVGAVAQEERLDDDSRATSTSQDSQVVSRLDPTVCKTQYTHHSALHALRQALAFGRGVPVERLGTSSSLSFCSIAMQGDDKVRLHRIDVFNQLV